MRTLLLFLLLFMTMNVMAQISTKDTVVLVDRQYEVWSEVTLEGTDIVLEDYSDAFLYRWTEDMIQVQTRTMFGSWLVYRYDYVFGYWLVGKTRLDPFYDMPVIKFKPLKAKHYEQSPN